MLEQSALTFMLVEIIRQCAVELLVSSLSSFVFGVDADKFVQNFQSEEAIK